MVITRILVADSQMLTRQGIVAVIKATDGMEIIGEATDNIQLEEMIRTMKPDVTLLDAEGFKLNNSQLINVLVLYNPDSREYAAELIKAGAQNFICKHCSQEEIKKAIMLTAKKERFFCSYSLRYLKADTIVTSSKLSLLSAREMEIVNLITTGMTNKDISEQLFLSIHTISTHRKNIIKKLGFTFKNSAELLTYISKIE